MKNREIFQTLCDAEAPKGALGASIGLHGVMILLLLLLPLWAPQTLKMNYHTTVLAPPPPPRQPIELLHIQLQPPKAMPRQLMPRPIAQEPELTIARLPVPAPKPAAPAPEIHTIPKPAAPNLAASIPAPVIEPRPMPMSPPPKPPVVTNVFSSTVSAPAVTVPVRSTEAAGFGDTNNIDRETRRSVKSEGTAAAGFGDVEGVRSPGGSAMARSVGSLDGFDAGVGGGTRSGTGRGSVATAGFTSAADAPRPAPLTMKAAEPPRNEKPVEILLKPRPDYSDEARKMRIEGEVSLRVLFTSSGEARVLEMIRGLGFGLNENAIRAAEQIRFKPAQRAGQPVDSTAIVHIVFQLAY